jgi:DNA-binding MarR family transcriptional regulator
MPEPGDRTTPELPLDDIRHNDYTSGMTDRLQRALKQTRPFDSLEQEVLVALQVATARSMEPFVRYLRQEAGITPAQYNVLRILRGAGAPGLSCGEIADRMIDRDPDVTRLLDRLVKAGLAERERDSADRRVVRVRLSAAGHDTLATVDRTMETYPKRLAGALGGDRLAQLLALLEDVIEGVSDQPMTNPKEQ